MAELIEEYKRLYNNLKKFNWDTPLFFNNELSLRFELQAKSQGKRKNVFSLLQSIFTELFSSNSIFLVNAYRNEDEEDKKYFNNRLFDKYVKRASDMVFEDDYYFQSPRPDEICSQNEKRFIYCTEFENVKLCKLIKSIYPNYRKGLGDCGIYLAEPSSGILVHIYDHRGMDIVFNDRKTLKAIYLKYEYWLIEHDESREKMKRAYEGA